MRTNVNLVDKNAPPLQKPSQSVCAFGLISATGASRRSVIYYISLKGAGILEERQGGAMRCVISFLLCMTFVFCTAGTAAAGRVIDFQGARTNAPKVQQKPTEQAAQTVQTTPERSSSAEIRVGLLLGQRSLLVSSDAGFSLVDNRSGKVLKTIAPNAAIKIESGKAGLLLDGRPLAGTAFRLVPQKSDGIFQIGAKHYRGSFFLRVQDGSFDVIEHLALDDYVNGVLAEEMPASWHPEALKAQAVAARTYALRSRERHRADGYDVCATTHCQLYGGVDSETAATRAAVAATAGQVLLYDGKLAETVFHSDSGGMTESREALWGDGVPYLVPVKEPEQKTSPWQVTLAEANFLRKLAAAGKDIGTLQKIELSPLVIGKGDAYRTPSGRVSHLKIQGSKRTLSLTGSEMRSIFGLKSTLFGVKREKGQVVIAGFGSGHGLGLSQHGAERLASRMKYDAILAHYYPGTKLERWR